MSVIQISQQTSLSGQALTDAITRMVREMTGMSPYRTLGVQSGWANANQMNLRAGDHMTGTVTVRSGPPSTVTLQLNLLSTLAQGQRDSVQRDVLALADRYLPLPGGVASAQPTFAAPAAPEGTTATTQTGSRWDWGAFGAAMTGLFGGAADVLEQYNAVGNQAAAEAMAVAQQASGKTPTAVPMTPSGVQSGPGFILGQGKAVSPDAPLPGGRLPSEIPAEEGATEPVAAATPSWVWWAVGVGGAVAVGAVGYLLLARRDDDEDWRRTVGFEYDDTEFERRL